MISHAIKCSAIALGLLVAASDAGVCGSSASSVSVHSKTRATSNSIHPDSTRIPSASSTSHIKQISTVKSGPSATTTTASTAAVATYITNGGFDIDPPTTAPWEFVAPDERSYSVSQNSHDGIGSAILIGAVSMSQKLDTTHITPGADFHYSLWLKNKGVRVYGCTSTTLSCGFGQDGVASSETFSTIANNAWEMLSITCQFTEAQMSQGNLNVQVKTTGGYLGCFVDSISFAPLSSGGP